MHYHFPFVVFLWTNVKRFKTSWPKYSFNKQTLTFFIYTWKSCHWFTASSHSYLILAHTAVPNMWLWRQTIVSFIHKHTHIRLWCSRSLFQGLILIYEAIMVVRYTSDGCRSVCSKIWPLGPLPAFPVFCATFTLWGQIKSVCTCSDVVQLSACNAYLWVPIPGGGWTGISRGTCFAGAQAHMPFLNWFAHSLKVKCVASLPVVHHTDLKKMSV